MKHNTARDQSSWLLSSINSYCRVKLTTYVISCTYFMILSRFHWLWEIFTFSVKIGQYHFQLIHLSGTRTRFRFRQDGQLLRIWEILPIPDREMMKYNLNKVPGTHRNCPPCEKPMALYPDCSLESLASWSQTLSICLLTFIRNPFSVS